METETLNEDIKIYYSGEFAAALKEKGDYSVEKSLQLLNYMKGKGYKFVGTSTSTAYFIKEEKKTNEW